MCISRRLGAVFALAVLLISAGNTVSADIIKYSLKGTLQLIGGGDEFGLDGGTIEYNVTVDTTAIPTSTNTLPGNLHNTFYSPISGKIRLSGTASLDGVYSIPDGELNVQNRFNGSGQDRLLFSGSGPSGGTVNGQIVFADDNVITTDPPNPPFLIDPPVPAFALLDLQIGTGFFSFSPSASSVVLNLVSLEARGAIAFLYSDDGNGSPLDENGLPFHEGDEFRVLFSYDPDAIGYPSQAGYVMRYNAITNLWATVGSYSASTTNGDMLIADNLPLGSGIFEDIFDFTSNSPDIMGAAVGSLAPGTITGQVGANDGSCLNSTALPTTPPNTALCTSPSFMRMEFRQEMPDPYAMFPAYLYAQTGPITIRVASLADADGDGVPDTQDPCPAVPGPANTCNLQGSAASEVSASAGGFVVTPDGNVSLGINPDVLASDATLSVTQTILQDPSVGISIGSGPSLGTALAVYKLEPDGLQFNSPITLTVMANVTALDEVQRMSTDIYRFEDTDGDAVADTFVPLNANCSIIENPVGIYMASCAVSLEHFSTYAIIVPQGNVPPSAVAGEDIQANEDDFIILDGTFSVDRNGDTLTFSWVQLAGPNATSFSGTDTATPTVRVPTVGGAGATMTFQLTVSDEIESSSDTVNIIVKKVNRPPVASLISESTVETGAPDVRLDGSGSFDPDLDPLIYTWEQTAGASVNLDLTDNTKPSFTAPAGTGTLSFRLIVSDGQYTSQAVASINVVAANQAPVANAGANQTVAYGSTVTLTGSATDADGDALAYKWTQTAGPAITLTNDRLLNPSFDAPSTTTILTFALVANDGTVDSAASSVDVLVFPAAAIPNCSNAHANRQALWPPNRTMSRVKIRGMQALKKKAHEENEDEEDDADDPDEDLGLVQIRVTSITQDEPTTGTGSGDRAIDAIVESVRKNGEQRLRDLILVKKERKDSGDGRIYDISFTATNTLSNASCIGQVQVCVPTKKGKQGKCVDSGQSYNSLQ